MQQHLSNNAAQILKIETPNLVIDPEGTRCRENAVCLKNGTFHVYICLPPEKFLTLPEYKLIEFIQRTFSLSSIVPLKSKNAELAASTSIKPEAKSLCLDVEFSLSEPFNFKLSLKTISCFEIYKSEDFYNSEHFDDLLSALRCLEQKFETVYADKLSPKRKAALNPLGNSPQVNDFEKKFGLLHNHAYHLVHLHLKSNQIPHLYMSTKDEFATLTFDAGKPDGQIEKAALASPLRKIPGFVNILQTAFHLRKKGRLFSGQRVSDLAANINELKQEAASTERKQVIRRAVSTMQRGDLSSQPTDFQHRIYLLIDNLAHSAPLPQDAWKLLLYEATPSAAKKLIIQHAASKPAYAFLLLYELNKSPRVCDRNYKIEEEVDLNHKQVKLKLFVKSKTELIKQRSSFEFSLPLKEFDQAIHQLRMKAIQKLAGYSVSLDRAKDLIPFQLVGSACPSALDDFVKKHIRQPLTQIGYTILVKDVEYAGLSFFQLEFVHESGLSYTYETAPNYRGFRENKALAVTEMLNFVAKKMSEFGILVSRPENDFDSDLPEHIKDCGLDPNLFKFNIKSKPPCAELFLEYKLRLIGNSEDKIKKTVRIKFNFKQAIENFISLHPRGSKEYTAALNEYLEEGISPLIKEETDKFLTEVARSLGYIL